MSIDTKNTGFLICSIVGRNVILLRGPSFLEYVCIFWCCASRVLSESLSHDSARFFINMAFVHVPPGFGRRTYPRPTKPTRRLYGSYEVQ